MSFSIVSICRIRCRWHCFILLLFISVMAPPVDAQNEEQGKPVPCSDEIYRAFDFWIGEWDVYAGDQLAGHNRIEPILNGCALSENWQSVTGGHGHSYNSFDRLTGHWNQFWVDDKGSVLRLVGDPEALGPHKKGMSLMGLLPSATKAKQMTTHRIRWSVEDHEQVRQLWESSTDGGDNWTVLFDGLYVPKGSPAPATKKQEETH